MNKQSTLKKADDSVFQLSLLPQYPQRAAEALKPLLERATMEEYKHFLFMMYHYTKDSGNKLIYAAEKSESPELKKYFLQMAKEERGHYLLAKRDYEGFGLVLDETKKPSVVDEFD